MDNKAKELLPIKIEITTVKWYPSPQSCVTIGNKKNKSRHLPPLMVRKADWRR